jgi:hypothetical protein
MADQLYLGQGVLTKQGYGRVLRASSIGFAVGCRVKELHTPAFGSLVKAQPVDEREAIYGIIYDMHIDDDPLVRRLVLAETPSPELINDQRENRMLPVEMSVMAVGYRLNQKLYYGLPPRPPLTLDPVFLCDDAAEMREFTGKLSYLRLLLRGGDRLPTDQLLVAHIRHTFQERGQDIAWVNGVVRELIELLRSNYDLLLPTLEALSDALPGLDLQVEQTVQIRRIDREGDGG